MHLTASERLMVAFTFILKEDGGSWSGKQYSEEEGDIEADASSTYDLQGKLYQLALQSSSGGGVRSSFSQISPSSAVYQVCAAPSAQAFQSFVKPRSETRACGLH